MDIWSGYFGTEKMHVKTFLTSGHLPVTNKLHVGCGNGLSCQAGCIGHEAGAKVGGRGDDGQRSVREYPDIIRALLASVLNSEAAVAEVLNQDWVGQWNAWAELDPEDSQQCEDLVRRLLRVSSDLSQGSF